MNLKEELIKAAGKFLVVGDYEDPSAIRELTFVNVTKDFFVGQDERTAIEDPRNPNQKFMREFCWPPQAREELEEILRERQKLRKQLDDSMGLVYQLNNKIARGDIK